MRSILVFLFLTPGFFVHATETLVSDPKGFEEASKTAKAGDAIVLKNGQWKDARLKCRASGTEEVPLTIKAETPGRVLLTGRSRLQISGSFVLVEGLCFQDPTGEEAIELRIDTDEVAHECRVTDCAVVNTLPGRDTKETARFISIYGREHRVDHCRFEGKTTPGPSMVVWLSKDHDDWGRHRIDHNYFGRRERLGKNGGETIRLGDSDTSMLEPRCVVEYNLFEKCDGEAECISNKSCGNLYRRNTFLEVAGTLTLRHGNRCTVEENAFLGNHAKGTGGVRVIGENHRVIRNYFENLTGDKERSALCVMAGIPNTPLNGYAQVKDARIEGNIFVDCKVPFAFALMGSKEATLAPENTLVPNNRFSTAKPKDFPDHPGLLWNQKDLKRPFWLDQKEKIGTSWQSM